jgi:hypothetical protein
MAHDAARPLEMDIVLPPGALHSADQDVYRTHSLLIDPTITEPCSVTQRRRAAKQPGFAAAQAATKKHKHYLGTASTPPAPTFDTNTYHLIPFAIETYGRLGDEAQDFIKQTAIHIAGGREDLSLNDYAFTVSSIRINLALALHRGLHERTTKHLLYARGLVDARGLSSHLRRSASTGHA